MDIYNELQQEKYRSAVPERKYCPSSEDSLVKNFALHTVDSYVNAYGSSVCGCEQTGADVMLTFGSEIVVLNGNNLPIRVETLRHIDVFLNRRQAEGLLRQLTRIVREMPQLNPPPPDSL